MPILSSITVSVVLDHIYLLCLSQHVTVCVFQLHVQTSTVAQISSRNSARLLLEGSSGVSWNPGQLRSLTCLKVSLNVCVCSCICYMVRTRLQRLKIWVDFKVKYGRWSRRPDQISSCIFFEDLSINELWNYNSVTEPLTSDRNINTNAFCNLFIYEVLFLGDPFLIFVCSVKELN